MAKTQVFKVVTPGDNGKEVFQYFGAAALPVIIQELFGSAQPTGKSVNISSFETDTGAVNLDSFFAAGGMLVGPIALP